MSKKDIIYILIIIFIFFLYFDKCGTSASLEDSISRYKNYKTEANFYQSKYDNEIVASNEALVLSKNSIDLVEKENKRLQAVLKTFNRVDNIITTKTEIRLDSIFVTLNKAIPCDSSSVAFNSETPYYAFSGIASRFSLLFDSISFKNDQSIVVGFKKRNILAKKIYTIDVANSNPHMKVNSIGSYTLKPKKSILRNKFLWAGLGFAGGVLLFK